MKRKRLLFWILLAMSMACKAATTVKVDSLRYTLNDDGSATVSSCLYTSTPTIVIPKTVTLGGTTYTVKYIGDYAFDGRAFITSVTFPNTLEKMGNYSFRSCSGLTSITLPASLTIIGPYAFNQCKGLTSLTIPANVKEIGEYAFQYCEQLETIDMKPQTMTAIGRNAFDVCKKLKAFRVPEGITTLGQSVFWGCEALEELTLPSTLTTIGIRLCYQCYSLKSIDIPSKVTSIGDHAFYQCKAIPYVNLPEGLTTIGSYTFQDCDRLKTLTLPASLTSLGTYAFWGCDSVESVTFLGNNDVTLSGESQFSSLKSLKTVKLPDNLSTITRSMFYGCEQLESIDLSKLPATEMRPYAFYNCKALASVKLPPALATLGEHAFRECSKLSAIAFPATLKTIGQEAFRRTSLTTLPLNDGLETIRYAAFADCDSLTAATLPNTITSLGENVFENCDNLKTVVFPKGLTALPRAVCSTCKKLTSVTLPKDLVTIGQYAFYEAQNLSPLVLPQTVETIGDYAFYNTKKLGAIVLPAPVKTVGAQAFQYSMMPSLTLNEGLETIGNNAFCECDRIKEVTIPSTIKSLGHAAFWTCDSLRTLTFAENMPNLTFSGDSHFAHNKQLVKVTLPKTGMTTMTTYMFRECTRLLNIELPATLTSIGGYAFYGCDSLQTIYIPDGVKSIGDDAFNYCRGLRYVRLPEGLETIGNYCFGYNEQLQYLNIPSTVTSIGTYAIHTTATSSNTNFKSIGIMGSTMPTTSSNVFYNSQPAFSLLVPAGQEDAYQTSTSWRPYGTDNRTIKGYPATKKTLTQDLIRLSCLNSETYRTGSPAAVWVDWFEGMGNYRVFYTDKKGNKTTVMPEESGDYAISLEFEEGPYYKPATFNNVGTFTLQEIADEDFALLWDFYSKTYDWTQQKRTWTGNGGGGAPANWNLIEGVKESAVGIFGVKWQGGHVQEINFGTGTSIYNLNGGETPVSLFALPQVKKIEIAGSELYGNISDKAEAWLAEGKTLSPTLEYLDLQRNKLEGNISTLTNALPALKTLDVHENRFSAVWPALPATLETLNISSQTITDITATIDLRDMTNAGFFSTLPSIVFYDPATRTYAEDIQVNVQSQTSGTSFTLNYAGDNDFTVTGSATWKDSIGSAVKCSYTDANRKTTNFNANFYYDMGDVDFNSLINVSDLQQSITYLMRGYVSNYRYNFYAGNFYADNDINVLDIVRHVDLLLSIDQPTTAGAKRRAKIAMESEEGVAEAKLYQEDGRIILHTTRPVAAIDMMVSAADADHISWHAHTGMTITQKVLSDGRIHIIIYSAVGRTLPTGEITLASNATGSSIGDAMLVDSEAKVISTILNDAEAELATGIEEIAQESENPGLSEKFGEFGIYTLQGVPVAVESVSQLPRGIYIVNRKKVIIK